MLGRELEPSEPKGKSQLVPTGNSSLFSRDSQEKAGEELALAVWVHSCFMGCWTGGLQGFCHSCDSTIFSDLWDEATEC